ncbi:MAG: hypothetical protein UIM53_05690 [Acutalibacteraceae bacterium]|nr:hypothetical protein [Acutalibacteraceae bacterium]
MTLEEAQAQIVELTEKVTELTNERDTLSENNKKLSDDYEKVRTLNQRYFEKLTAQDVGEDDHDDNEEVQSLEDFARSLTI